MRPVMVLFLAAWLAFPCLARASQWPEAARMVQEEAGRISASADRAVQDVRAERQRLRAESAAPEEAGQGPGAGVRRAPPGV